MAARPNIDVISMALSNDARVHGSHLPFRDHYVPLFAAACTVRRALPIIPLLAGEARKCQSENNDAVMRRR